MEMVMAMVMVMAMAMAMVVGMAMVMVMAMAMAVVTYMPGSLLGLIVTAFVLEDGKCNGNINKSAIQCVLS